MARDGRRKRTRSEDGRPALSGLEVQVMNAVWDLGEAGVLEVQSALAERRELARTTVGTVLSNIEKKGYLERIPTTTRSVRYRPVTSRRDVAQTMLGGLVGSLFGGSRRLAILTLLDGEELTQDELEEIADALRARGIDPDEEVQA